MGSLKGFYLNVDRYVDSSFREIGLALFKDHGEIELVFSLWSYSIEVGYNFKNRREFLKK